MHREKASQTIDLRLDGPEGNTTPKNLAIKFTTIENPYMQKAFLLAMKANKAQEKSRMRAIASVLVLKNGKYTTGISGEIKGEEGITGHAKHGYCIRYQDGSGSANSDYDSCPGCTHKNHSERVALRKAIAKYGEDAVRDAKVYLYGHWFACGPCTNALSQANVKTVYLLENAREISDRSNPKHEEVRTKFENEGIHKLTD